MAMPNRQKIEMDKSSKFMSHPIEDLPDPHPLGGLADTAVEHVVQGYLLMVLSHLGPLLHLCLLAVRLIIVQCRVHGDGLLWSLHRV